MKLLSGFAVIACLIMPCKTDSELVQKLRQNCSDMNGAFWHFDGEGKCYCIGRHVAMWIEC